MKCLACPYCPKPHKSKGIGKHYVEIKTVGGEVFLVAVCCTCKYVQFIPVDVKAKNCGKVIHCGTNNRHKVMLTNSTVIISCGKCRYKLSFKKRTV